MVNTVQHTHVVTSVKQSPVLKGHLTYKDTFSFPKDDLSRHCSKRAETEEYPERNT